MRALPGVLQRVHGLSSVDPELSSSRSVYASTARPPDRAIASWARAGLDDRVTCCQRSLSKQREKKALETGGAILMDCS